MQMHFPLTYNFSHVHPVWISLVWFFFFFFFKLITKLIVESRNERNNENGPWIEGERKNPGLLET